MAKEDFFTEDFSKSTVYRKSVYMSDLEKYNGYNTERGMTMRCEVKLDATCTEPYACIVTKEVTPEIRAVAQMLSATQVVLYGYRDEKVFLLQQTQIVRMYAMRQKVYAETADGTFVIKQRLYELEEQLSSVLFVRISNSEIVNSRCIHHLDIGLTGTIGVYLADGTKTYASRRYVPRIKQFFGIGKEKTS